MVTDTAIVAGQSADIERGAAHALHLAARGLGHAELSRALYHDWYLGNAPFDPALAGVPPMVESLAGSFRAAHAGSRMFEGGWTVADVGRDGTSVVQRGERQRLARPSSLIASGGLLPRRGDVVKVRRVVDDLPTPGGFWHTFSDRAALDMSGRLARVYWNTTPESAVSVVAALTELLVDSDVGWQLKCLSTPDLYARPDSTVLYLLHGDLCMLAGLLSDVHRSLRDGLAAGTPALARPLARGVAWAAQPPNGDSFGEHRCGLLARAALEGGSPSEVAEQFASHLRAADIDPAAPHRSRDMEEPEWTPSP
ncbi:MAG: T3SS effector HopA1 family protein [Actinomycetota bacterium]|nr:T3SS effector HopA1 family protein [Actinomycetota bacterium]